jgi:transposase
VAGAQKKADREGRTVVFVDESAFYMTPAVVKTWAPAGQTPTLRAPASRDHLSAISGLTLDGRLFAQVHPVALHSAEVIGFVRHLLRHLPERLLLLWDRANIHRSKELQAFLELDTIGRLQVEHFPAYAPEVDPDEYVWRQLKRVELRNLTSFSLSQLRARLQEATRRLRRRAALLRNLVRLAGLHV